MFPPTYLNISGPIKCSVAISLGDFILWVLFFLVCCILNHQSQMICRDTVQAIFFFSVQKHQL